MYNWEQSEVNDCYEILATAVICKAYSDMLRDRITIESIIEPNRNKMSKRFNKVVMKSAKRYKENLKEFKTKKEELEYYERFKMEYVKKLEDDIASIERFFRSELFDLYSHGANGEYFINRIEAAMDDFFAGKEVMIPNTTYINTKGEHKIAGRNKRL